MAKHLNSRKPVYLSLVSVVCLIAGALLFMRSRTVKADVPAEQITLTHSTFAFQRFDKYHFIRPLMLIKPAEKASGLRSLSDDITALIEGMKQSGQIADASFYFADLQSMEYTGYGEDEKYAPGSLLKTAVLVTWLRMEEEAKGTLDKSWFYEGPFHVKDLGQGIPPKVALEAHRSYTTRELLSHMIMYSDNNAAILLDLHLPLAAYLKTFTDLGIPPPNVADTTEYGISSKDYSLLMQAIFNGVYLTPEHSEYAATLLSAADFDGGFRKGFPAGIKMLQKYGEAGTLTEHQLSESGIVYVNGKAYLFTVMTKGADMPALMNTIRDIAARVFQGIKN